MPSAEHEHEIQDLVANGANEPLGKRVGEVVCIIGASGSGKTRISRIFPESSLNRSRSSATLRSSVTFALRVAEWSPRFPREVQAVEARTSAKKTTARRASARGQRSANVRRLSTRGSLPGR